MKVNPITKEEFISVLKDLKAPEIVDSDYTFEVYEACCGAVEEVSNLSPLNQFTPINHIALILYIINEYLFMVQNKAKDVPNFKEDEELFNDLASKCADKYITNEQLNYKSGSFLNRFNPAISTLELYSNFILRSLEAYNPQNNRANKLVKDMLEKAFKMIKCIDSLLIQGFETEAFSTWRTLHENECILICLIKYPNELFKLYFKHTTYALAYRGQIKSKEETDKIFVQIKDEMKQYDLKSKDMKKYIEYGYLFGVPGAKLNETFKLNFRDGVENVAGLSSYSKVYETASEIAHSSPLLLYSRRDYFFNLTILNLYETFFRLEKIFSSLYSSYINDSDLKKYIQLRNTYLKQINLVYERLKNNFIAQFGSNKENKEENKENEKEE